MSRIKLVSKVPKLKDSKKIFSLIKNSKPLDLNSEYAYMLICEHFKDTSVIAEIEKKIVGVITGYVIPNEPDTLFIWQVAVDKDFRGKRIPYFMFENLLSRKNLSNIKRIKTTISPSNSASQKMFEKFSVKLECSIERRKYITQNDFLIGEHEDETLYTIGPFNQQNKEKFYENI